MAGLTPKQKQFVAEYLIDLNATQAAIRAGYSAKTASITGHDLLRNPKLAAALAEAQLARASRTEITADRVLAELAKLGFANMLDFVALQPDGTAVPNLTNLTRDQAAALSEVTVEEYTEGRGDSARKVKRIKIKLSDKRAALVDIGRHIGMFPVKVAMDATVRLDPARLTDADLAAIAAGGGSGAATP